MGDEPRRRRVEGLIVWLRRESVQLGLLLLFLLAVHLPKLGVSVGSPDEEGSPDNLGAIQICRQPLGHITTEFHKARNHPLYSILGHFTVELPLPTLVAARIPALLAGMLVPAVFYFTHRSWVGQAPAILVSFLLVLADPLHHYVTAARGYAMLVLGTLVMNQLLMAYVRRRGTLCLVGYSLVAAATIYTHLWALLILGAHAVYVAVECGRAIVDRLRGRGTNTPIGRWVAASSAILVAAALALLLYRPMLPDILAMAGARRASRIESLAVLADGLLQLARFRNATLAAYLLLVPIVLEGLARKLRVGAPDGIFRFHMTVLLCASAATLIAPPQNFDSRFLMGLIPSGAALIAWALSGYWLGAGDLRRALLPQGATWLAGFALGVVVSNASMTVDIPAPAITSQTDSRGVDHGYFYRNLPKSVGNPVSICLLAIALLLIAARNRLPCLSNGWQRRAALLKVRLWSGVLLVSLPPLVLGPNYFRALYHVPRWLFEVHLLATAALWLLAWENRFDDRALRALRWGLVLTGVVVVVWQLGGDRLQWDAWVPLRLLAIAPPALVGAAVARTSDP